MTDSTEEIKKIKLEISSLAKNIQTLSVQFDQMNSLLFQLLSSLEITGEFADEEAVDFMENQKFLHRLNELKKTENPSDHTFQ